MKEDESDSATTMNQGLVGLDLAAVRRSVSKTQVEASVQARCSPPTTRAFERFGPTAVRDPATRERLSRLYLGWAAASRRRPGARGLLRGGGPEPCPTSVDE
ncbi:MAG: hypothetical protein OXU20_05135 [Myxococcales bacterium]|nr:hypothetical protein [Myxococcales bacterium]